MSTTELIVWLLACYGITFLLCGAKLTATPRRWLVNNSDFLANLLACYFCTGFWVSIITACWVVQTPLWAVLHGFAGATSSYILDAAIRRLEAIETMDGFAAIKRLEETIDGFDRDDDDEHSAAD